MIKQVADAAIQEATKHSVDEISSIARIIDQLSAVASTIAAAVDQQGTTTLNIVGSMQNAADGTVQASDEIRSIEQAAGKTSTAVIEIAGWTERLSARARDLEVRVASFFAKVPRRLTGIEGTGGVSWDPAERAEAKRAIEPMAYDRLYAVRVEIVEGHHSDQS